LYLYSLNKIQQFARADAGVNKHFRLSERSQILVCLQGQGNFAIVHQYQQQWDSATFTPSSGWTEKTTQLPGLKGKNFFQWQIMVPIGFEYMFFKESFYVRLELAPGIIGSRYRPRSASAREAHSAGIWLAFKPKVD
jgi:hypothetical protein